MSSKTIRAKEVGERIKLARKESGGMTQRELGDILGVTERSIAAYETGEVIPYRFLRALESALSRPAAWFLYGDKAMLQANAQGEVLAKLDQILALLQQRD